MAVMLPRLLGAVVGLVVAGMAATAQGAFVNYEYVGNLFNEGDTSKSITGYFLLDTALPADVLENFIQQQNKTDGVYADLIYFSFSDGDVTINLDNSTDWELRLVTDSLANILDWRVDLQKYDSIDSTTIWTCLNMKNFCGDRGLTTGQILNNPGTWTKRIAPIPAALPLFGTGLAVLGFMGWRRKRQDAA